VNVALLELKQLQDQYQNLKDEFIPPNQIRHHRLYANVTVPAHPKGRKRCTVTPDGDGRVNYQEFEFP
jgi:hypothetical protein